MRGNHDALICRPSLKRKVKKISFDDERKEHDVVIKIVRECLDRQGIPDNLWDV
jgi:hypothetical protein